MITEVILPLSGRMRASKTINGEIEERFVPLSLRFCVLLRNNGTIPSVNVQWRTWGRSSATRTPVMQLPQHVPLTARVRGLRGGWSELCCRLFSAAAFNDDPVPVFVDKHYGRGKSKEQNERQPVMLEIVGKPRHI